MNKYLVTVLHNVMHWGQTDFFSVLAVMAFITSKSPSKYTTQNGRFLDGRKCVYI